MIPLRKLTQAVVTPQRDMMEGRNLQIPCLSSALCNPDGLSRGWLSALNWFWGEMYFPVQSTALGFSAPGALSSLSLPHGWPWGKSHFSSQTLFSINCKMRSMMPKSYLNTMDENVSIRVTYSSPRGWWTTEGSKAHIDAQVSWDLGEVQSACLEAFIVDPGIPKLLTPIPTRIFQGSCMGRINPGRTMQKLCAGLCLEPCSKDTRLRAPLPCPLWWPDSRQCVWFLSPLTMGSTNHSPTPRDWAKWGLGMNCNLKFYLSTLC